MFPDLIEMGDINVKMAPGVIPGEVGNQIRGCCVDLGPDTFQLAAFLKNAGQLDLVIHSRMLCCPSRLVRIGEKLKRVPGTKATDRGNLTQRQGPKDESCWSQIHSLWTARARLLRLPSQLLPTPRLRYLCSRSSTGRRLP